MKDQTLLVSFAAAALLISANTTAQTVQTVTVTTAKDVIDISTSGTIQSLPGKDGKVSFSEAMIATNNTKGHQIIKFAIPKNEWILQFLYPGRAVITSNTGFYFRASEQVTIDGTSQTAFTGDTNKKGREVVFYRNTVFLNAANCKLIGIDSSSVTATGRKATISGNTGTMNVSLFGGGQSLIQGNECGTIKIDRSSGNIVVGNKMQRVRIWGFGTSMPAKDNRIGGKTAADRNYITGYGTWNSEGIPAGTAVELFQTTGTIVENNYIGTTKDGLAQGNAACNKGIELKSTNTGVIIRNNLIAGILGKGQRKYAGRVFGWAVYFAGTDTNTQLTGNTIGLDAKGAATLGSVWGIDVGYTARTGSSKVRIQGNTVAGHLFNGVTVGQKSSDVRLDGNSIYANKSLGIDLVTTRFGLGVTPNDAKDPDAGGNGLQNYPVLTSAGIEPKGLRVKGTLNSTPSSSYTLQFFASPKCDPTGSGEGQVFLGATKVATNSSGNASFDIVLTKTASVGWSITATATVEPGGSTSEFSRCVTIVVPKAAVTFYGLACSGSVGTLTVSTNSLPKFGNNNFSLTVGRTRPKTPAGLYVATRRLNQPLQGCTLLIDLATQVFATWLTSDSMGNATQSFKIPSDTSLAGIRVFGQWFNADGASKNLGLIGGGAATQGVEALLGN